MPPRRKGAGGRAPADSSLPADNRRLGLRELLPALWLTMIYLGSPLFVALELYLAWRQPLIRLVMLFWVLYINWGPGKHAAAKGTFPTFMRGRLLGRLWVGLRDYFPARIVKTAELPPGRSYLLACHPHGVACCYFFTAFSSGALGFGKMFPGLNLRQATVGLHFKVPIAREYALAHGYVDASYKTLSRLLSKPGVALALQIGGGAEAVLASPGTMDLCLDRRKGFVRVALVSGAALVPVLALGENELMHVVPHPKGSLVDRLSTLCRRLAGFTLPLAYGQGCAGLRYGPWPLRRPLHVVVGAPLEVPHFKGDHHSEECTALVEEWHAKYVAALTALWEAHRDEYGEPGAELRIVE